jgi:hypothetical protein
MPTYRNEIRLENVPISKSNLATDAENCFSLNALINCELLFNAYCLV